jgi:hypothetical protein
MPSLKINLLYGSVAITMGMASTFVWSEESSNDQIEPLPVIKVEATRTDTPYMQTPASVYRVDAPKNDQSLQVNLTELVKGFRAFNYVIGKIMLKTCSSQCVVLVLDRPLGCGEYVYMLMEYLQRCLMGRGKLRTSI